ncbi:MAG: MOSC domain-containing protein [Chloroflexi bacterium]|nr:MOSC domain-containing protein [Chloroflexota bacterium]OQB02530.1 MAG: MOSC domain protein [Chloroflexi bacterium ADurb.Bin222]HOC22571.1 MOSC domain-containing protein [Anaerolineae bacterium]HOS78892.1 MOSC domain-containing protein [Anaerolineae bacterium]HQJ10837.1 MOSC domain-containing protein [Anaerolineae bacterium]
MPRLIAINRSSARNEPKTPLPAGELVAGYGLVGDAHAGLSEREVSVVAIESIIAANERYNIQAGPGSFADNLTTEGLDLSTLQIGSRLRVGSALLEVVQIGKPPTAAHTYSFHGVSILPDVGIFCRVLEGGQVVPGDAIEVSVKPHP